MNAFAFNARYYLQIPGTAMGTCIALSCVNLLIGKLEREFLRTQNEVPRVWWRYINDIFTIWMDDHGEPFLRTFSDNLNRHQTTIKFTANWSAQEIMFSDTTVSLVNGHIQIDLHIKPTDTHEFLDMDSCHPKHCYTVISCSQALRSLHSLF